MTELRKIETYMDGATWLKTKHETLDQQGQVERDLFAYIKDVSLVRNESLMASYSLMHLSGEEHRQLTHLSRVHYLLNSRVTSFECWCL